MKKSEKKFLHLIKGKDRFRDMKEISYPAELKVPLNEERGKKLDKIAERDLQSRPGVILKALDFYFAQNLTLNQG